MRLSDIVSLNVRAIRLRNNMTQDELAKMTGVAQSTIGRIEANAPQITTDTLERLAAALHVSPCELVDDPQFPRFNEHKK